MPFYEIFLNTLSKVLSKYFNLKNHLFNLRISKDTPALQASVLKSQSNKRAYQRNLYRGNLLNASITFEATLSFPIFLFAVYLMTMPLNMMSTQRKMQAIAESVAKNACQYAYIKATFLPTINGTDEEVLNVSEEENEQINLTETFISLIESGALTIYTNELVNSKIDDKFVSGVSALGTTCMLDDEMINVRINYKYNLPFSIFGLSSVEQRVQSSRRAWVGKDEVKGSESSKEDDEEMVYVGRTSTRYHLKATCHYLYNDIKSVNYSAISSMTNKYGSHFKPCARCAKGVSSGTVYIMPSGTSFHTSKSCSAITAYVRKVKKSEVESLGVCSYCGGVH